jgi:hypothetical protein
MIIIISKDDSKHTYRLAAQLNLCIKRTIMKKNMGNFDRISRSILAVILGVLYLTGVISGTLGLVILLVGVIFLLTSLVSFCPLYTLIGINTCSIKK